MFRVALLEQAGGTPRLADDLSVAERPLPPGGILWVDIEGRSPEAEAYLEGQGFHPLTVDDAFTLQHQPKVEAHEGYLFVIVRGVDFNRTGQRLETLKLAAFVTADRLITYHRAPLQSVQAVWQRLAEGGPLARHGVSHLLYLLVDELMDRYFPLVDQIAEEIEAIEEAIFVNPEPAQLERILSLRRRLTALRRVMLPHRQIFNHLSSPDTSPYIDPADSLYFRDVYDNVFRLADAADQQRDQLASTRDTYLSAVSQKTNDVMKVLTVFSAVLLPLGVITGLYGTNFADMPGADVPGAFWLMLGAMATITGGMLFIFKHKGWF